MRNALKTSIVILGLLALAACNALPTVQTFPAQSLNGKPLSELIAIYGAPTGEAKTPQGTQNIWVKQESSSYQEPVGAYMNGRWITTGSRTVFTTLTCDLRATTRKGIVIGAEMTGTRFACSKLFGL